MNLVLPVNEETYVSVYLQLLNGVLKLTKQELRIIEAFVVLGEITTESRIQVRELLNLSASGLNNYLKVLRQKNVLTSQMQLVPLLTPDRTGLHVDFQW